MWTATIVDKKFQAGSLQVNVSYTDGVRDFNEIYDVRDATALDSKIVSRLAQLNSFSVFEQTLQLGTYVPLPVSEPVINDEAVALVKVQDLKHLVDLGILSETDTVYTDAVNAARAVYTNDSTVVLTNTK